MHSSPSSPRRRQKCQAMLIMHPQQIAISLKGQANPQKTSNKISLRINWGWWSARHTDLDLIMDARHVTNIHGILAGVIFMSISAAHTWLSGEWPMMMKWWQCSKRNQNQEISQALSLHEETYQSFRKQGESRASWESENFFFFQTEKCALEKWWISVSSLSWQVPHSWLIKGEVRHTSGGKIWQRLYLPSVNWRPESACMLQAIWCMSILTTFVFQVQFTP